MNEAVLLYPIAGGTSINGDVYRTARNGGWPNLYATPDFGRSVENADRLMMIGDQGQYVVNELFARRLL